MPELPVVRRDDGDDTPFWLSPHPFREPPPLPPAEETE